MSNNSSGLLGIKDIVFMNVIAILKFTTNTQRCALWGFCDAVMGNCRILFVLSSGNGMWRAVHRLAERRWYFCLD